MTEPAGTTQKSAAEIVETIAISNKVSSDRQIRFGLTITLIGYILFLLGARPGVFGLDRSPVIGFVQIAVFLVGLAILCVGGYSCLMALWGNTPPSIAADIGLRMVATGYLVAVFTGMADVFGLGSHTLPGVPFFGFWQAAGVMVGEFVIIIGLILCIPFFLFRKEPPPEFNLPEQGNA